MMPDSTHAALVVSADKVSRISSRVRLNEQLRTASPANPWEAGWLIAGYTDPERFYYVACKTNGWELGKRDPTTRVARGSSPPATTRAPAWDRQRGSSSCTRGPADRQDQQTWW